MSFVAYYEDIEIGAREEIGSHTFTAEAIKRFARMYDPQYFHVDENAAKRSHFGGLVASGWHTGSVWMGLAVRHRDRLAAERRARGEPVAELGPSPGFRDLRWLKPVQAGDTVVYSSEVVEKRESASKPAWGIVYFKNTGTNQKGELVLSYISTVFIERRPA